MDNKLFKLLNIARTQPERFKGMISEIIFEEEFAVIDQQKWQTNLNANDITAVINSIHSALPELKQAKFYSSPVLMKFPKDYHMLLVSIHICLDYSSFIFDPSIQELSIIIDVNPDFLLVKLSGRQSALETLVKSQSIKNYGEKARKIAYEIVSDTGLRKKFKKMMLEGFNWITELARMYGPFTGYEINEFMSWFKTAEKELPRKKFIPKAKEPKSSVLPEKIIVNEAGIIPQGSVIINKSPTEAKPFHPIESSTNGFCQKSEESVKFTFKAKQRYKDLNNLLHQTKGNVNERMINNLPENECEEIIKEPPISVPEKYEAFLLEEVLIAPPLSKTEVKSKPFFNTNFRLPDNLKIKIETAKMFTHNELDIHTEPYKHKFRDEFDPKAANKPDFILRLPKPEPAKVERISEPLEKIKRRLKEEKAKMEAEEKKKRTELYGKNRGEWVASFKPVSSFYEMGTGKPYKLLPKHEYVDLFKVSSRAS